MPRHLLPVLPLALLASFGLGAAAQAAGGKTVTMNAISPDGVGASVGTITLEDSAGGLVLQPNLKGLPPGQHGFHLHAKASCAPGKQDGKMAAGIAAGGHFDPGATKKHLGPDAMGGHKGDLPVLKASEKGINQTVTAPQLKVTDVRGRALMIHEGGDNYTDTPENGGGGRIACGVVPK